MEENNKNKKRPRITGPLLMVLFLVILIAVLILLKIILK
jgi:hypothetical protein